MKVYDINGNITTDIRNILHKWKINLERLLNRPVDAGFNDEFYYECLHDKTIKKLKWKMKLLHLIQNLIFQLQ